MQKTTDSSKSNAIAELSPALVDKFQQAFNLHQQGQLEQADILYTELLKEQPQHIDALHFSGVLANQCGQAQRAVDLISLALEIDASNAAAHSNLGLALYALSHFDEALVSYNKALALKPSNAETHYNCGNALLALNRFNEALTRYNQVLTIKPDYADAHWGASWCYLSLGNFDRGWKEYEWRWQTNDFKNYVRNFSKPQWFGEESLRGKTILLHNNEQGLGDTLQFCRYAKRVADLGAMVILEVPKTLLGLLAKLEGVTQLITQGSVLPAFDFHCPLLSLPLAFKTHLDSIPVNNPYLFSEPDKVKHWQAVLGEKTKPRVGLVWAGNAVHKNDRNRSLALHELLPLLMPHCQFISLQKELRDTDKELLAQQPLLQHYGEQINDFTDTAALCELMDLVISVDTSVAHLAAAMDKPTWILLPYNPDWRWLIDREDSPWYPTARLFRQKQHGDWQGVIECVQRKLVNLPTLALPIIEVSQRNQPAPNHIELFSQALSLHQQGQLEHAEVLYEQQLKNQPQHIDALHFLGVLVNQRGQSQRAVELISQALEIAPNNAAAHSNLGLALQELKRFDEAIASYDRSLALKPNNAEAYYNRGNALLALTRFDEAILDYERALAIKPDYAQAFSNLGNVLLAVKRYQQALASYESALTIKPDFAEALAGRGAVLNGLKRFTEALSSYEHALAIKPDLEFIRGTRLHTKMNICAWHEFDHDLDELTKAIERGEKVSIPFTIQAVSSSAALQKKAAEIYSQAKHPSHFLLPPLIKHAHSKIKVGYFSSDFRNHPVALLTAELFECHDRSRFEIIAFSFHEASDKDDMRLRLEAAFDQFIDVSEQSDEQVVRLARQLEIDIAVDLNGCTEGCRTDIFALRAAPIQVNYIGYLGTMGADYIDYLLADSVLIPTEHQAYYQEKIAYLPYSFQVNDSTLQISTNKVTRVELGLPEQGVVFCCFNNHYKITPTIFASWMRILRDVENSVLWLVGGNVDAESNLRLSATAHGIAAQRLVFAQRVPMPEYLARHRLADLFLDTSPYNAGATASAALWAGLPLITFLGTSYSSRMAASLLNAIGLPELVTQSVSDYETLAIQLATHPEQLAAVKQKLSDNRLTTPLFNTALFTQHIESAFQMMFDRYQAGLAPDHIYVPATGAEANLKPVQQSELTSDSSDKFQRAVNYHQQGQLAQAEQLYQEILLTEPQHADSLHLLGAIAKQRGQAQLAVDLINQALDINPNNAAAHSNIGLAYQELNRFELALASYNRALSLDPHYADAYFNRGTLLLAHKEFDQALSSYDQALIIKPDFIEALFSRGIVLTNLKRHDQALASYDRALSIKPDYIEALINKANVLQELKRYDEALASCERALAIKPEYAEALFACAVILQDMKRFKEAISFYERAFTIKSDMVFLFGDYLYIKRNICDWTEFDAHLNKLANAIEVGEKVATPFTLHSIYSSPELLKKAAETYAKQKYPCNFLLPPLVKNTHSKIKIGYFSSDFCQHAVSYLIAELFERHDRSRFEIIAFSFHATSHKDDMRLRLEAAFDQFIDVSLLADKQIVQLARQIGCDIAVDLNGFTANSRTGIFAMRAAPIQVSYLGFLGTMGTDYMDYLLADSVLIPTEQQIYYNEKIAYLPNSFQVNDSTLSISNKVITRAEFGLPEQGFVFCCFNNHYKITPAVFKSWMRILHHVNDSVLWLLGNNNDAEKNLQCAASEQGISSQRLIFAQSLPMDEYLAQCRLADLFLDTSPYNAGATASAALWAGLPLITFLGTSYSSRMAASLLNAIGLPELITTNLEDYEALAIQLATHPEQLTAVKQKLADNRLTTPLFNTALFTQHIESAFQMMFDRYQAGLAPDHLYVPTQIPTIKIQQQPLLTTDVSNTVVIENPTEKSNPPSLLAKIAKKPAQLFAAINVFGKRKNSPLAKQQALTLTPDEVNTLEQAQQLHHQGQLAAAELLYQELLKTQPKHAEALRCVAMIKKQRQTRNTVDSSKQTLPAHSNSVQIHFNKKIALQHIDRLDKTAASVESTLVIEENTVEELINRGNELEDLGRFDDALASYDRALSINPDYARAHSNRGNVLQSLKRFDEALDSYDRALAIRPDYPEAFYNLGNTLQACKRFQEALVSYDHALRIKPDFIDALIGRGNALQDCRQYSEALISYDRALAIQPNYAEAHSNRGIVLKDMKRYDEALACYERALAIKPNLEFTFGDFLIMKITICDWNNLDSYLTQLIKKIERGEKTSTPFPMLAVSSSAALQKKVASCYANAKYPSHFLLPPLVKHAHSKIKLAYFSADFRIHATTQLIAELFDRHDRSRFEIIAFSFHSANHKDAMRLRLEAVFDQFIDVSQQSDEQVVRLARELEIDIAVDLKGFTDGCRPNIFAMRAAPIQVSYLGYPATMGADYIDYLLADSVLIPKEYQHYYTEFCVYLPNSYQVNDTSRVIANRQFTRAELGLPEQGFVFCCFNNNYKITPVVFDSWMRILHHVEGSVLWLLEDNATAARNLRLAATARGINSERIIFAQRLALPEHLARHRLADLFLDTLPCNAHTTTSDALWAGLPVLTCMGEAFASRVAASLLSAVGLPELITTNLDDYQVLAIQLATHPEQLDALKQKLADNRLTTPLFDTELFTQHIESAFQMMFDRYQAGLAPNHIYVSVQEDVATTLPCAIEIPQQNQATQTNVDKLQQALSLHQQGQLEQAEMLYQEILHTEPQHVDALHFLGVLKNQNGQSQRAVDLIQQSLTINAKNSAAYLNLGIVFQALNRFYDALICYDKVLELSPDSVDALLSQANLLQTLNRPDEALTSYNRALTIKPDFIDALIGRGSVLQILNRFDEAVINYDLLLSIDTHHAEALFGQANTLYKLKRLEEALTSYDRSLAINPNSFEALYNRGVVLADLNRVDEAIVSYQDTLAINPDYAEVHNNLGILLKNQHRYLEAEACYRRAIEIKPDYCEAHCNLINLLKDQGQLSQAEISLQTALVAIPDSVEMHFIQIIMSLPIIPKSAAASILVPSQFDDALTNLSNWINSSVSHQESLNKAELLPLPFLLAYRTGNHVQRLSRYGDLVTSHSNSVSVKPLANKIRMVVVSHHFYRHSVWDVITRGLLVNLDRSRFELILYHLGKIKDQETTFAKSLANKWRDTHTITELAGWLAALETDAPDVIFYPEIGMDPLSARLASHRFAALQIASWGHPITTGLPNIDLYFSGDLLESPNADSHYRERLIRLPNTGCCTTPINISPEPLEPELVAQLTASRGVRFIIAQTIYKFDPVDDALYATIASVVHDSVFILLSDRQDTWATDQIVARLEQCFVDRGLNPKQHLLVIPRQSMEKFQTLLDLCDVYLDCPSFSGYTTAWQAVHRGLPIVTLEGEFMRQRLAAGLLRKIGLTDTIASSREDYVQCAAQLAEECRDPNRRAARRYALKTAASKADNDLSVVRAFEQCVIDALAINSETG